MITAFGNSEADVTQTFDSELVQTSKADYVITFLVSLVTEHALVVQLAEERSNSAGSGSVP